MLAEFRVASSHHLCWPQPGCAQPRQVVFRVPSVPRIASAAAMWVCLTLVSNIMFIKCPNYIAICWYSVTVSPIFGGSLNLSDWTVWGIALLSDRPESKWFFLIQFLGNPPQNGNLCFSRIWGEFLQTGFTQNALSPMLVWLEISQLLCWTISNWETRNRCSEKLLQAARNRPFTGISNWETCNRCSEKLLQAAFSYVQLPGIVHSHGHGNPNIILI